MQVHSADVQNIRSISDLAATCRKVAGRSMTGNLTSFDKECRSHKFLLTPGAVEIACERKRKGLSTISHAITQESEGEDLSLFLAGRQPTPDPCHAQGHTTREAIQLQ